MANKYQLKIQLENILKQHPDFLNNPIVNKIRIHINEKLISYK